MSDYCNVSTGCSSSGNYIHHNTVFVPSGIRPEIVFQVGSGDTDFYNNLIEVGGGSPALTTSVGATGVTLDAQKNLFYPAAQFSLVPALSSDALTVDPQLRSAGADDPEMYKLLPGSPAKSSGVLIGAGQDYFGFPVAADAAPHIGAYNGDETFSEVSLPTLAPSLRVLMLLILCGIGVRLSSPGRSAERSSSAAG